MRMEQRKITITRTTKMTEMTIERMMTGIVFEEEGSASDVSVVGVEVVGRVL